MSQHEEIEGRYTHPVQERYLKDIAQYESKEEWARYPLAILSGKGLMRYAALS